MNYLANKPGVGVFTWFVGWAGSFIPEDFRYGFFGFIQTDTVFKSDLLWGLQMLSLTIGSLAGILTIVTLVCKINDRSRALKKHKIED